MLSQDLLPQQVDIVKSCQSHVRLSGKVPLEKLPRLSELLAGEKDDIQAEIRCSVDEQGLLYFQGSIQAELELSCQRCLDLYDEQVKDVFCFSPVYGEQEAKRLPGCYEPVVIEQSGVISLYELIEDELMINIPFVPKHTIEDCQANGYTRAFGDDQVEDAVEKPNPFAQLESLKVK
ncbi:YceD family protein [Piscirickettsia salmonis]|uniref:Large ribosomal RNA subunit accumulation protein YceD n=1 Tax=Piscirickettsia salmonis TaxID=1238 RepID=A0A9Q5VK69_PISSA|nr:YceD family protein [Piscirickettsia salmonis]RNC78451.1 hypothetical protein DA717_04570 [Piscirickettsiaceae bacterium NZ-RLO2]ALA24135.1 hypothetical protein KW89_666 [Piscirickettsia salmonis]PEQ17535.1 hypothetical protein X973_01430 [Piscirickettsia salmonis]QGN76507.1 hypothetical protein Psal001_00689 [Piscirickettsia salmonis]QGN80097.1 hypothetical protein Psal002_00714 [Piscirickettsia salmonis]